jgi:hypothetical protein
LHLPDIAASVKAACILTKSSVLHESEEALESEASEDPTSQTNFDSPSAPAYPDFQPIRLFVVLFSSTLESAHLASSSTLYRKKATGFGEWDITIAPRAERDLREYNRRDRKTFVSVVKKMRFGLFFYLSTNDLAKIVYKGNFPTGNSRRTTISRLTVATLMFQYTKRRYQGNFG